LYQRQPSKQESVALQVEGRVALKTAAFALWMQKPQALLPSILPSQSLSFPSQLVSES
jgi:hypothetical protein